MVSVAPGFWFRRQEEEEDGVPGYLGMGTEGWIPLDIVSDEAIRRKIGEPMPVTATVGNSEWERRRRRSGTGPSSTCSPVRVGGGGVGAQYLGVMKDGELKRDR